DFEYENEVEVKKGFLTGREERETGRKVVSAEEFERIRQTVSSAHDVLDDYEQIRETDFFKENEELKSKNLNYAAVRDRKSTRLNSSHVSISYAVFCLKKK